MGKIVFFIGFPILTGINLTNCHNQKIAPFIYKIDLKGDSRSNRESPLRSLQSWLRINLWAEKYVVSRVNFGEECVFM